MPDQIARKRLKKRMLERWENEGGKINDDTTSADAIITTSENKNRVKNLSSTQENSTVRAPASSVKGRKSTRK